MHFNHGYFAETCRAHKEADRNYHTNADLALVAPPTRKFPVTHRYKK